MPLCTIAIVNYNSQDILVDCLNNLANQTFKDFEIQIIDNNSHNFNIQNICKISPNIFIIHNKQNIGFAAANNQALDILKNSKYLVLLNPDAFPEPYWLESLVEAKNRYPEYTIYGSRLLSVKNPDALDGDGDIYHISGLAWRDRKVKNDLGSYRQPFEIFSACAAAAMYRVDAIKEVGGFDDDFFCYMEDVDLGFRMRLAGHKCLLVPEAVASHVGSATSGGQNSDFAVYHGHRNLVWTYIKNMPGILFWFFLPLHVALNLVTICWFSLRGKGRVILRAKLDALRGLPKMWRKRKMIQGQRIASNADILRAMDKSLVPLKRIASNG